MAQELPQPARKEFEKAVALFNEGRLATAEGICADLETRYPQDVEIAHFGGVVANRMNRYDVAVRRLARCVQLQPKRAKAHAALGLALEQLGRWTEARESFERAIRADPSFAQAYNGLGVVLVKMGDPSAALPFFDRAIALDTGSVEARLNAAHALLDMAFLDAAAQRFREAAALARRDDLLRTCAAGLYRADDIDGAERIFRALIESNPSDAPSRAQLALVLEERGLAAEALAEVEAAVASQPSSAAVRNSYGAILLSRKRSDEAAVQFREAVALDPGFNEAAINLAVALREKSRDEARAEAEAIESKLDALGCARLAMLYTRLGDTAKSIELCERAIALSAHLHNAHATLSTQLLRTGELERGWREHLYRPSRGSEIFEQVIRGTYPPKLPADLAGVDIVILSEQGLGDMLLFLRYAAPLARAGARLHLSRLDPRIAPMVMRALAADLWPDERPVPANMPAVWAGDLPLLARPLTGSDVCPSLRSAPLPGRIERMRERLGPSEGKRVGVAWRAGTRSVGRKGTLFKDIEPRMLGEALAGTPLQFVSIQRIPEAGSTDEFEKALGAKVIDCSDVNEDLEDTLALLSLLDDYAGVSSTNIHLLAALGRTGRVLIPYPPNWRWQSSGESVWFEGFATYRQTLEGDWSGALEGLRGDLTREAKG